MGKGKKKFVDKKNATTFIVVNKGGGPSEIMPHTGDGPKPVSEKVFMPIPPHNLKGKKWSPGIRVDEHDGWSDHSDDDSGGAGGDGPAAVAAGAAAGGRAGEIGVRLGNFRADDFELGEYGFPDDGYDYRQHFTTMGGGKYIPAALMGDVTAAVKGAKAAPAKVEALDKPPAAADLDFAAGKLVVVKSASSVAEKHQFSDAEEDEVMRLLESSEEAVGGADDAELLDTFVADAMDARAAHDAGDATTGASAAAATDSKPVKDRVRFADADFESDDDDSDSDYRSDGGDSDDGAHGPQRGRGGVVSFPERKGDTMADQWLTHMMDHDYDDEFIGEGAVADAYSDAEYRGKLHSNQLTSMMDQFLEQRKVPSHTAYRDGAELGDEERRKTLELAAKAMDPATAANDVDDIEVVERDDKWDCESILSTYSNTANHPHVLVDEGSGAAARRAKAGKAVAPKAAVFAVVSTADEAAAMKREAAAALDGADNGDDATTAATGSSNKGAPRSKQETPEERRARKAAVKAERRTNRANKKATKVAYKDELLSQRNATLAVPFFQRTVINMSGE